MKSQEKCYKKGTKIRHFSRVATVILVMFLCLFQIADETILARPSATKDKIAFESYRDNPQNRRSFSNIYVIDADGTNFQQLTKTGKDRGPTWSPDGKQLAFSSTRNNLGQIFVMDADGGHQHPITQDNDLQPDWSPDGKKIAFVSYKNDFQNGEIYIMNPDGSDQRRLTNNLLSHDSYPSFSPDSKKIAFLSNRDNPNRFHLYVMNADGTNTVKLTRDSDIVQSFNKPSWSPDGHFIAFVLHIPGIPMGQDEIYQINADGTNLINLTNHPASDHRPSWSPDGSKIAFYSDREGGDYAIYVMNADGTGVERLTAEFVAGYALDWYGPRNLAVTPHQKRVTSWGWLKGNF